MKASTALVTGCLLVFVILVVSSAAYPAVPLFGSKMDARVERSSGGKGTKAPPNTPQRSPSPGLSSSSSSSGSSKGSSKGSSSGSSSSGGSSRSPSPSQFPQPPPRTH